MSEANIAGARPLSQFLRLAVMAGVESAVQIHIERGDDLNARDASGMTPLMLSAARNKPAICKLLLGAGADHALLDPSGKTALEIAIAAGSEAAAAILEADCSPIHSFPASTISTSPELDPAVDLTPLPGPISIGPAPAGSEEAADPQGLEIQANASASEPALPTSIVVNEIDDVGPSGKTALEIAIAAGSKAAAAILEADCSPIHSFPASTISTSPELDPAVDLTPLPDPISIGPAPAGSEEAAEPQGLEIKANASASEPALPTSIVVNEIDDEEFDLSGWEAEEPPARPEADLMVLDLASAVQTEITAHEPIDSSAGWDDIDAYLPEVALPLARADDAEGRAQLRRLLLRAIREGSVPSLDVQAQSSNEDRSANPEAEAYLAMVINDLGAEVDERFEYSDADENFEVFIDPEETPDEEAILDDALVAIDRAASPRHEPLRIYQREFQRLQLLTAEKEIQLAKDMEAALDKALDALTGWPDGIARTLAAGAEAIAGFRQLSSIWAGVPEPDPEPASAESQEAGNPTAEKPESTVDEENQQEEESTVNAGKANFAHLLQQLDALVGANAAPGASPREIREALAALRLNRRFLLELIDDAQPCPGFRHAMADFRKARDCMAAANLKLSFFLAKKYLNSGELLDDLAQEGNIGLLKAVDRYDWRRGFRFSTYATWWIRQQIGRYIADKVRVIRVPVHIHEKLKRAERMAQDFETAAGREPTLDELAERVGMPRHKLAALLSIAPEPSSIDDTTIDSMIASDARDDYTSPDPADVVDGIQLNHAVNRFISSLSTRDRKEEHILRMRFGIGINEALTLDEIGTRFEVTRERIRQIEAKALRKLRHPNQAQPFARMALGLHPEEPPLAPIAHEHEDDDEPEATEAAPLDQVLAQATELGIQVEDGRETPSGLIWVCLVDPSDNPHRRLARKLIEFGFEHSPGKGYWK